MKKKELAIVLLLLVCTIPSVLPLLHHGFFQTDDGEWMIIRLSAFYQALHDGQFPVRWLQRLNFGYGYPVAEFLYPGSFYIASLFHIVRFGFVNSIKMIYGVSLIGSSLFTYFWLRKLFTRFSSFIGALFALYLPYHLYDVYTRSSVEVFALLWVPFILWQIERGSFFYTAIGITLLILSHNILAALFLPFIICYMLLEIYLSKNKKKTASYYSSIVIFSLGLSTFFWLPILFELQNTVFSSTVVSGWNDYFVSVQKIGYITFVVLFLAVAFFVLKKAALNKHRLTLLNLVFSIVSVGMAMQVSSPLWQLLPVKFIQFPFRFLSIIVVTIPFLAAFCISILKRKQQWLIAIILFVILFYSSYSFIKPANFFDKGEGYYYTNDATTTVKDEYMPIWVKQKPVKEPVQQLLITKGEGKLTTITATSNLLLIRVQVKKYSSIQINRIYWPGWKATLDGRQIPISYTNSQGVMTLILPKGNYLLKLTFGEDQIRLFADILSGLTLLMLIFLELRKNIFMKRQ